MKKKVLLIISGILLLVGIIYSISFVKADSGWDSDYDSDWGSDWDSDYDSDWGSDWDYDDDYSWSYGDGEFSYSGNGSDFFAFLVFAIIIIVIILKNRGMKKNSSYSFNFDYKDVSNDVLEKYGIDLVEFKKMVFDKYVAIQNAWSEFDYDALRNLLTDELYNSYTMQLDALQVKKQKNIMSDFSNIDCKITKVTEENNIIDVTVYLRVQMFDYVIDKDNKVVRGNKNQRFDINYIIHFVKTNESKETTCPNCGAKINVVSGGKCEYCRAIVVTDPNEYVMSSKSNIGQRRI